MLLFLYCYAECHYAVCRFAEYCGALRVVYHDHEVLNLVRLQPNFRLLSFTMDKSSSLFSRNFDDEEKKF